MTRRTSIFAPLKSSLYRKAAFVSKLTTPPLFAILRILYYSMRISRKKRPDKPLIPLYRKNQDITSPQIRVIDDEGKNIGVLPIAEALQMAQDREMDLIEINPKADPPVAQILEYTHFKYQKEKEARKQKVNTHTSEMKGIRLSPRIGDHDLEIRRDQAEKFLERGDKVKAEIILRGREGAKPELAFGVIKRFFEMLNMKFPVRYEQDPLRQGNKVIAVIAKK